MYRNIKSLICITGAYIEYCRSIIFKKKTNSEKKKSDLWLPEGDVGGGEGELDEDS